MEWKMIPPASPHFGGMWESGIVSIKFHLKRMIGETKLTFEELTTLLTQIEAELNSRSLSKTNHNDVANLDALIPSHFFLTGDVITSIPEQDFSNISKPTLLKRFELLQQMKQGFWKRYYKEYLNSLQQRYKWKKQLPNLSVGDIVLIKKDGNVRVVTVKAVNGYF
ncbi:uncharacterized protein LOC118189663 [Stegodyphus dumicola]|uniref:uncharacterized protein LOC118189663 n=1 Tax=Stegodyphus dumicola TaxID=202533 RepID=UPI0015AD5900|nr:uncharacterized protein LOC118189663 [Stegodyphus dumicola]